MKFRTLLLLTSLLAPAPVYAGLYDDLVLCLEMNEGTGTTISDATGNGHTGTLTGTGWTTGKVGSGAIDLDGADDKIAIAHDAALNVNHFTVALWYNLDNWNNLRTLISKSNASSPFPSFDVRRNSGVSTTQWQGFIVVGSTQYTALSPTVTTGEWQHLALTYDGEELFVYVNGVAGTTNTSMSGNLAASTVDLWVGGNPGTPTNRYINGKVDQFAVWSEAKTAGEIAQLYNNGNGLAYPFTTMQILHSIKNQ